MHFMVARCCSCDMQRSIRHLSLRVWRLQVLRRPADLPTLRHYSMPITLRSGRLSESRPDRLQVTDENKEEYVNLLAQFKMTGSVRPHIDAFCDGLWQCIPCDSLRIFSPEQLGLLIAGRSDFNLKELQVLLCTSFCQPRLTCCSTCAMQACSAWAAVLCSSSQIHWARRWSIVSGLASPAMCQPLR